MTGPALTAIKTEHAAPPGGTYSQAIRAGDFVFIAGQVPKKPSGERINDAPFEEQARLVLANLVAVAEASGGTLGHAVKVNVFLRDATNLAEFDRIYQEFAGDPPAARTSVQSDLPGPAVEVDAILYLPLPTEGAPDAR